MDESVEPISSPADENEDGPHDGVGLAVSGGGYRATLSHLDSFLRLFEVGILKDLDRISSVSGGSTASAKIGLERDRPRTRAGFMALIADGRARRDAGPAEAAARQCAAAGQLPLSGQWSLRR